MADVYTEAVQTLVSDIVSARSAALEDLLVTALILTDEDHWAHIMTVETLPDWYGPVMMEVDVLPPVPTVACRLVVEGGEPMADPANVAYAKVLIRDRMIRDYEREHGELTEDELAALDEQWLS